MHLKQFGRILRRNLWIILVVTLAGGAIAYGVASVQRPEYSASTRTLYSPASTVVVPSEIVSTSTILAGRIATYADLVATPLILDPVIAELGLNATTAQIGEAVTATVEPTLNVIMVTATSSEAAAAAALADSVAQSLSTQITNMPVSEVEGVEVGVRVSSEVVQPAVAPARPSAPDIPALTIMGLAIGFAVGVILAGIRAYTDSRIRTRDDITESTRVNVPVEGLPRSAAKDVVVAAKPASAAAETYRRFVAELEVRQPGALSSVLVTSPNGQSDTPAAAANVAAALAEGGSRVALVDADLRGGTLASRFGVDGTSGLSDVLRGKAELSDALRETSVTGVSLLPAGAQATDPHALLGSPSLGMIVDDLRRTHDSVVISAPGVLHYADALLVSQQVSSSIVVVSSGDTTKRELTDTYEQLGKSSAGASGVLLTAVPRLGADASWR